MAVWAVSLLTTDLSTHGLSAILYSLAFGVWLSLVSLLDPLAHPVLYLQW